VLQAYIKGMKVPMPEIYCSDYDCDKLASSRVYAKIIAPYKSQLENGTIRVIVRDDGDNYYNEICMNPSTNKPVTTTLYYKDLAENDKGRISMESMVFSECDHTCTYNTSLCGNGARTKEGRTIVNQRCTRADCVYRNGDVKHNGYWSYFVRFNLNTVHKLSVYDVADGNSSYPTGWGDTYVTVKDLPGVPDAGYMMNVTIICITIVLYIVTADRFIAAQLWSLEYWMNHK
jgi:hypothetical protein